MKAVRTLHQGSLDEKGGNSNQNLHSEKDEGSNSVREAWLLGPGLGTGCFYTPVLLELLYKVGNCSPLDAKKKKKKKMKRQEKKSKNCPKSACSR